MYIQFYHLNQLLHRWLQPYEVSVWRGLLLAVRRPGGGRPLPRALPVVEPQRVLESPGRQTLSRVDSFCF